MTILFDYSASSQALESEYVNSVAMASSALADVLGVHARRKRVIALDHLQLLSLRVSTV